VLYYPSENDPRGLILVAVDGGEIESSLTLVNESPIVRTARLVSDKPLPVLLGKLPDRLELGFCKLATFLRSC
jgi:hypothetical protein